MKKIILVLIISVITNIVNSQDIDNKYITAITYFQNTNDIYKYLDFLYPNKKDRKVIEKQKKITISVSDEIRWIKTGLFCKYFIDEELNFSKSEINQIIRFDKKFEQYAIFKSEFKNLLPESEIKIYFSIPFENMLSAVVKNENNPNNSKGLTGQSLQVLFIFDKYGLIEKAVWGKYDLFFRKDYLRKTER